MRNEFMGPLETQRAAMNLQDIQYHMGGNINPGLLDASSLSKELLSPLETQRIAMNLQDIQYHMQPESGRVVRFKAILAGSCLAFAFLSIAALAIFDALGLF